MLLPPTLSAKALCFYTACAPLSLSSSEILLPGYLTNDLNDFGKKLSYRRGTALRAMLVN